MGISLPEDSCCCASGPVSISEPRKPSQCLTADKLTQHLRYTGLGRALQRPASKTEAAPALPSLTGEQGRQTLNVASPSAPPSLPRRVSVLT